MGMELAQTGPDLVTLTISGVLTYPELAAAQKAMAKFFEQQGSARVLVNGAQFAGFAKDGDWGDIWFYDYDHYVRRLAILFEPQLKDVVEIFVGKGKRPFPIETFHPAEAERAASWLEAIH